MKTELPDPSTPINEALETLGLPPSSFPAVRTFGDLLVEIERGHIEDGAVLKALGKKKPPVRAADANQ